MIKTEITLTCDRCRKTLIIDREGEREVRKHGWAWLTEDTHFCQNCQNEIAIECREVK